jgi:hypothetical protein
VVRLHIAFLPSSNPAFGPTIPFLTNEGAPEFISVFEDDSSAVKRLGLIGVRSTRLRNPCKTQALCRCRFFLARLVGTNDMPSPKLDILVLFYLSTNTNDL